MHKCHQHTKFKIAKLNSSVVFDSVSSKIRINLQIPVSNIRKETVRSLEEEYKLQRK